jgi:hypothetical protein
MVADIGITLAGVSAITAGLIPSALATLPVTKNLKRSDREGL